MIQDLPVQHIYLNPKTIKRKYLLQNEVLYLVMQDWVAEPDGEIFNTGTNINSDDSDDDNDVDFI